MWPYTDLCVYTQEKQLSLYFTSPLKKKLQSEHFWNEYSSCSLILDPEATVVSYQNYYFIYYLEMITLKNLLVKNI